MTFPKSKDEYPKGLLVLLVLLITIVTIGLGVNQGDSTWEISDGVWGWHHLSMYKVCPSRLIVSSLLAEGMSWPLLSHVVTNKGVGQPRSVHHVHWNRNLRKRRVFKLQPRIKPGLAEGRVRCGIPKQVTRSTVHYENVPTPARTVPAPKFWPHTHRHKREWLYSTMVRSLISPKEVT